MKKVLLSIFALASVGIINAQVADCTANYDFGDEPFGVSPDPVLGESFDVGEVGENYFDIIHIKVPEDASQLDLDVEVPPGIQIDSIALETVTFTLAGTIYTLEQMGLEIECNNNGDSPNTCTFMGGSQNCATLSGIPTTPGEFGLTINVIGYVTVFGNVTGIPVDFDQYTLTIEGEVAVLDNPDYTLSLGQNMPNPATGYTRIPLTVKRAGNVNFTVINLLGEIVVREQLSCQTGYNEFNIDIANLNAGIYLYSIEVDGKRMTKRMIVNR